jgi:hypothetical protein
MSAFSAPAPITFQTFIMDEPENGIPAGYSLGTSLGKGDFGQAYQFVKSAHKEAGRAEGLEIELHLPQNGKTVLKKVNLVHDDEGPGMKPFRLKQFTDEVKIGYKLGSLGIAPKIYQWWICENADQSKRYGYYVMETLSGVWASRFGKNVADASIVYQQQLISNVIIMVQNGFIHQDLHPGNVGFVGEGDSEKVVLFDFGLTLEVDNRYIEQYGSMLVASQLYQMIEQSDIMDIIDPKNYVFNVIQYIVKNPSISLSTLLSELQSNITPSVNIHTFRTQDFEVEQYNVLSTTKSTIEFIIGDFEEDWKVPLREVPSPIGEAILMLRLYNILIHSKTKDQMYGFGNTIKGKNFLYNLIYLIRNNKITIAQVEEWLEGTIIPETLNSMKSPKKEANQIPTKVIRQTTAKYRIRSPPKRTTGGRKSKTKKKKRRSKTRKMRR